MEIRKASLFETKLFRKNGCGGGGAVLNKYQFRIIIKEPKQLAYNI